MPPVINRDTLVPIGMAVAVGSCVLWGVLSVKDGYSALDKRIDVEMSGLREQLVDLNNRLERSDRAAHDAWTAQDMEIFALRLRIANASLAVPEVREIHPRK